MFFFLFIFNTFSALSPQQTLDELVLGEWTIQETTFSSNTPSDQKINYYSTLLKESFNAKTFDGDIYVLNSLKEKKSKICSIRFVFDPEDYTLISVYLNETEPILNLHIETSQNGLAISSGNLLIPNYTYSVSILSYKAVELTVYDHENSEASIFRMSRTVKEPKGSGGPSLNSLILPLLILSYLLFSKGKDKNDQETENEVKNEDDDKTNVEHDNDNDENNHEKRD